MLYKYFLPELIKMVGKVKNKIVGNVIKKMVGNVIKNCRKRNTTFFSNCRKCNTRLL